ncbi:hypothetical protein L5515_009434 [Caenorhabditis briggsae]|uniref:CHK kinase-like domain-containing protein n=1 Tax=Caenorhabditis briggsae TaxID=6238 RepID=A0AAE9F9S5_CAEBR|nr:hypothetical protein L5515_009434 [Caenorhabditis briggsae]
MSLYKPSSGLLETHVTWHDVEEEMQKALGTNAVFGPNKKATNIGDLKGFMSRIALIDPDWQGTSEDEKLPEKFAVKISSQIAHAKLASVLGSEEFDEAKLEMLSAFTRKFHNQEVEAYRHLMKFNHPDIPYTKVYALKSFSNETDLKAYIISDFVPNVHCMGMHQSISANDITQLIRGVATFSALAQSFTEEELSKFSGPEMMESAFAQFFDDEQMDKMFGSLDAIFGTEHKDLLEKVVPIFRYYKTLIKNFAHIQENPGFKLVLNHNDLWQANMLHSLKNDRKGLKLEAIIDWQCVGRGAAGSDMVRVLICCLNAQDRREKGEELLKLYYETFTKVHGEEYFTMEELHDSYNIHFPLMAMIVVPLIMPFLDSHETGEEKEKYREENIVKLVAIMEDVIDYHAKNIEKFPTFMNV